MVEKKLAIIASGGGMKCSYTAGVVIALAKELNITDPDIVIAGSGSSGTMAYYLGRQYDSVTNAWTNLLSTKTFINPLRLKKIIDIDFLVDQVFKVIDPLFVDKVKESKSQFYISTTDYENGSLKYFSKDDNEDIFEMIRASKAMPVVYNKKVNIGEHSYCDSFMSSSPYTHIKKAIELGATHIIVIDCNGGRKSKLQRFVFGIWALLRGNTFRSSYYANEKECINTSYGSGINMVNIHPRKKLKLGTLENSKKELFKTFYMGYNDCKEDTNLRSLLSDYLVSK